MLGVLAAALIREESAAERLARVERVPPLPSEAIQSPPSAYNGTHSATSAAAFGSPDPTSPETVQSSVWEERQHTVRDERHHTVRGERHRPSEAGEERGDVAGTREGETGLVRHEGALGEERSGEPLEDIVRHEDEPYTARESGEVTVITLSLWLPSRALVVRALSLLAFGALALALAFSRPSQKPLANDALINPPARESRARGRCA